MSLIVATGTNGFIGTNILEMLLSLPRETLKQNLGTNEDIHLLVGADLPETATRSLQSRFGATNKIQFVPHTDLERTVRQSPHKPIGFIHNGACSSTEETNPEVFATLNLGYSQMAWNLCAELNIPFIYASSAGVYGDGALGFSDKKYDCGRYLPLSLYAKSKHDFDMWALAQSKMPPSWFGLRYFNVYGPHEAHKGRQASMAYHLFHQIRQTGRVRLYKSSSPDYADGGQMRDFVSVKDIATLSRELLLLSWRRLNNPASQPLNGNGLFLNIGTGVAETWNGLAQAVFEGMTLPPAIEYMEMPATLARQYQNYTCADLSSWSQTGIVPQPTPMHQGVVDYVRQHLIRSV